MMLPPPKRGSDCSSSRARSTSKEANNRSQTRRRRKLAIVETTRTIVFLHIIIMSMLLSPCLAFSTAVATIKTGQRCLKGELRVYSLANISNGRSRSRLALFASSSSSSSTASDSSTQQQQQEEETAPYPDDNPTSSSTTAMIPCIVLRRSQQSKAFRNGNQLVFTRAIRKIIMPSSTSSSRRQEKKKELSIGDLVQVQVEADEPKQQDKKNNNSNNNKTPDSYSFQQQQQAMEQQQKPLTIGWGVYNPNSLYRIRILCHTFVQPLLHKSLVGEITSKEADEDQQEDISTLLLRKILQHHFSRAIQIRRALNLPSCSSSSSTKSASTITTTTDTFRQVNGEGDQLSGLAVDVIGGNVAVVMSSAAWCQVHKDLILKCLQEATNHTMEIVWKTTPNRLQQDGYEEYKDDDESDDNNDDDNRMVIGTENGIQYAAFPFRKSGQKTSVYCDQRDNRKMMTEYSRGHVLDLCCYHGGFALNAFFNAGQDNDSGSVVASCTGVDSSRDAIESCRVNAQLNGYNENGDDNERRKLEFIQSDITAFLQNRAADAGTGIDGHGLLYDVVILDPPKLAPQVAALDKARRKYHALNRDAVKVVNRASGGLFLTCTCSAAMTQKDGGQYFLGMVQGAAQAAGRQVTLLRVSGAASCHVQSPVSWPAGNYLTAALFFVHPTSV